MAKLIGNAPNQVPTNADLGSMAFEDRTNYITKNNPVHQPFRNIIINGDMSIAQRGTSATGITSAPSGTVHAVDRMSLALSNAGTWTVSQETDAPTGQGFNKSLKFLCTTNEPSIVSNAYITFIQKFEGQNLQYLKFGTSNAQSLTASFWIKSSKTGNIIVELADRDNVKHIGQLVSIDTANTWEKKTVTFQGNTANTFNNDNLQSMDLQIWFGTGTTYSSGTLQSGWQGTQANRAVGLDLQLHDTTNANVYLTGVQLEAGTTASDFEFLPVDVNLQRCQRYFEKLYNLTTTPADGATNITFGGAGGECSWTCFTTNNIRTGTIFKVEKRTTPTITLFRGTATATAGTPAYYNDTPVWVAVTSPAVTVRDSLGFWINSPSPSTKGSSYLFEGGWTANAEL